MRRALRWGLGLLAAGLVVVLVWPRSHRAPTDAGHNKSAGVPVGVNVGNRVPDVTITKLGGQTVKLSSFRGKPVFINFWGTWCPPCQAEMPDIQRVYSAGTPVEFVAINATSTESQPSVVSMFVAAKGYTYPFYLDADGSAEQVFQIQVLPTSYFIDAQGVIQDKVLGPMDAQMLQQHLQRLAGNP